MRLGCGLIFHSSLASLDQVVLLADQLLQLGQVCLVAVAGVHHLRSEVFVRAVELPHASLQHAWDFDDFVLGQLAVLVLETPEATIASVLAQ